MTVTHRVSPWMKRLLSVVIIALVSTPLMAQQPSAKDLDRLAKLPMPKAKAQMKPVGELADWAMVRGDCTGSVSGATLASCAVAKCQGSCCQSEATLGTIIPDSLIAPEWNQPNVPFPSSHVKFGSASSEESCTGPCCAKPACESAACASASCAAAKSDCTKPCCSTPAKPSCCSDAPGCPGDGACGMAGCGDLAFAAVSDKPCRTTGCCEVADAPRFCATDSCCPSDCQHCVDSASCDSFVRCPSEDCFDPAGPACEADCCGGCDSDMSTFISETAMTMSKCLDTASPEDRCKMIEATMMLVAQNAQMSAAAQVAELKRQHECELSEMRVLLIQTSNQGQQANGNMHQWMNTIYGNQNRNYQQMQQLMSNNTHLNRMLMMLEKQMARTPVPPQRIMNSTFEGAAHQTAEEMRKIEQQIAELQTKLKTMEKPTVRPVHHLQPLYTQPQLLAPIPTPSTRTGALPKDGWRR